MKLRKLENRDASLMLEWMHDSSVTAYLQNNFSEKTLEDCCRFIEDSRTDSDNVHMAIADENDTYMGTVSLKHIEGGVAEFAIAMRTCAMGKGFSQYGMAEILRHGLENLGLKCIYWCVNPANKRAVRFYDKNGYDRINVEKLNNICKRQIAEFYSREQVTTCIWYQKGVFL